jgi:hypothetical protein
MPRKKKNGHSPARVPGLSNDNYYRIPGTGDGAPLSRSEFNTGTNSHDYGRTNMLVSTNNPGGISATSQDKDEIVRTMKEMFCHLDPEVLYIVLAECDFKGKMTS